VRVRLPFAIRSSPAWFTVVLFFLRFARGCWDGKEIRCNRGRGGGILRLFGIPIWRFRLEEI